MTKASVKNTISSFDSEEPYPHTSHCKPAVYNGSVIMAVISAQRL